MKMMEERIREKQAQVDKLESALNTASTFQEVLSTWSLFPPLQYQGAGWVGGQKREECSVATAVPIYRHSPYRDHFPYCPYFDDFTVDEIVNL